MTFKIGAHVSIEGGFTKALEREKALGGNCGQIFVKSPRTWHITKTTEKETSQFKEKYEKSNLKPFMAHGTYLINLATPKEELFQKSIECLKKEIEKTNKLSLPYITFHPGSHTGSGEEKGINKVIQGLNELEETLKNVETQLLLENTSGKGSTLGHTFPQLERMIKETNAPNIGVCLDTAHAYGAGYDFKTTTGIQKTLKEIKKTIGLHRIRMIHLNDSLAPLGSRKDQHAHGTNGEIGKEGIKNIVNHKELRNIPMVRETNLPQKDIAIAKELRQKQSV